MYVMQVQIMAKLVILLNLVVQFNAKADQISCPILQCNDPYEGNGELDKSHYDLCWKVEEEQPMKIMNVYSCDWYKSNSKSKLNAGAARQCDFSPSMSEFAWLDELT